MVEGATGVAQFVQYLWLIPVGVALGACGTLIGAGGGFLLVPLLLLVYPHEAPEIITSISLAVVFFNAASGSAAYARQRRIDYLSSGLFAAATIPGAVIGALTTYYLPRRAFDLLCGVVMLALAGVLLVNPLRRASPHAVRSRPRLERTIIEADGTTHTFAYNPLVGIALSLGVGFLSSVLGIGGGIIHVPALVNLLGFPVHIATASSHFILAIAALAGTLTHIVQGAFHAGVRRTVMLAIGVLIGAQFGAALSSHVGGSRILRGLALALVLVGVRLVLLGLGL